MDNAKLGVVNEVDPLVVDRGKLLVGFDALVEDSQNLLVRGDLLGSLKQGSGVFAALVGGRDARCGLCGLAQFGMVDEFGRLRLGGVGSGFQSIVLGGELTSGSERIVFGLPKLELLLVQR